MLKIDTLKAKLEKIPSDKFPQLLFTPVLHEFDNDEYFVEHDESDPRLQYIRTNPKTKNIYKYIEKMEIWKDYMSDLAAKYNCSIESVQEAYECGIITEFIPKAPKLKKTKETKALLKSGIMPSRTINPNFISRAVDLQNEQMNPEALAQITDDEVFRPASKELRKSIARQSEYHEAKARTANMFGVANERSSGLRFISEYYNRIQSNGTIFDTATDYVSEDGIDVSKMLKENEKIACTPDYILDAQLELSNNAPTWVGGLFVDQEKRDRMELLKAYMDAGYDPRTFMSKKTMQKNEIRMIKNRFDGSPEACEDQYQQWKKTHKKVEKKKAKLMKRHMQNNNTIASILTRNAVDLRDDMEFSFDSIMNGRD